MTEVWLPVVGYEGYYEVSSLGCVRNLDRIVTKTMKSGERVEVRRKGGILKQFSRGGQWYPRVTLTVEFVKKTISVHTLVLEAFVGPAPDGMECRHLDGDQQNNRLDNLEWGTHVENMADTELHGTKVFGERIRQSVLTEVDVKYIRKAHAAGSLQKDLARRFRVSKATICRAVHGDCWSHVQ